MKRILIWLLFIFFISGCGGASVWRNFKPESGTAIVGRVIDPKGIPIQSAQISTNPDTDTEFTNEHGYFAITVKRIFTKDKASTIAPIPSGEYLVYVDKNFYKPHEPIKITFSGGIYEMKDIILEPEPIDIDISGFRPTKSDPTLPVDASDPRRE